MLALPDDHGGRRPQQADGGGEGEGVQQPQLDGEVVVATFRQRWRRRYVTATPALGLRAVGGQRSRLPLYGTGRLPMSFRSSFWLPSVKAGMETGGVSQRRGGRTRRTEGSPVTHCRSLWTGPSQGRCGRFSAAPRWRHHGICTNVVETGRLQRVQLLIGRFSSHT